MLLSLVSTMVMANISNDMSMTDLTIGALTALHRICESIDSISSTASSHSRAFVIEVMGRHCGWLALLAGIATGADFIFIPENPPASEDWESEMCNLLKSVRLLHPSYSENGANISTELLERESLLLLSPRELWTGT